MPVNRADAFEDMPLERQLAWFEPEDQVERAGETVARAVAMMHRDPVRHARPRDAVARDVDAVDPAGHDHHRVALAGALLRGGEPVVLRPGHISPLHLEAILGRRPAIETAVGALERLADRPTEGS